jgi:hypothetical protein
MENIKHEFNHAIPAPGSDLSRSPAVGDRLSAHVAQAAAASSRADGKTNGWQQLLRKRIRSDGTGKK